MIAGRVLPPNQPFEPEGSQAQRKVSSKPDREESDLPSHQGILGNQEFVIPHKLPPKSRPVSCEHNQEHQYHAQCGPKRAMEVSLGLVHGGFPLLITNAT